RHLRGAGRGGRAPRGRPLSDLHLRHRPEAGADDLAGGVGAALLGRLQSAPRGRRREPAGALPARERAVRGADVLADHSSTFPIPGKRPPSPPRYIHGATRVRQFAVVTSLIGPGSAGSGASRLQLLLLKQSRSVRDALTSTLRSPGT